MSFGDRFKSGEFFLPQRPDGVENANLYRNLTDEQLSELQKSKLGMTQSGRITKNIKEFSSEKFKPGSGCCEIRGADSTDMEYDGFK